MSQRQRRIVRLSADRPQLVLQTERRPFDPKRKGQQEKDEARTLFDQLTKESSFNGKFDQFVGFLCAQDATYICLPKIFRYRLDHFKHLETPMDPDHEALDEYLKLARLLRGTLKKYKQENDQTAVDLLEAYLPDRSDASKSELVSHLMLAETILKDYQRSGLWIDSEQYLSPSDRGKVNWKRTIQRGGELWVGSKGERRPVYLSPMTYQRRRNLDHPITQAQLAVLYEIDLLYAPLLDDAPLILPETFDVPRLESFGALTRALESSLREVFQERPRRLAQLLLKYLKMSKYRGKRDQVDIYGTTSFHTIFESMCASVLSNQDKDDSLAAGEVQWNIARLPNRLRGSAETRKGSTQYLDLISKVSEVREESPYIQWRLDPEGRQRLILDAKYYDFIGKLVSEPHETDHLQLNHVPGIGDIRKQYAYQTWVEKRLQQKEGGEAGQRWIIANGLLFPTYQLKAYIEELGGDGLDKIFNGGSPLRAPR